MTYTFTVHGKPVPKGRPRVMRSGHTYTPQRTLDYEELIWQEAVCAGIRQGTFGSRPVWIGVMAYWEKPKASGRDKTTGLMRKDLPYYQAIAATEENISNSGDLDNFFKAAMDGLAHMFAIGDSQVVGFLPSGKFYGEPRMVITVTDEAPAGWPTIQSLSF